MSPRNGAGKLKKLPRLPKGTKIEKRPLLHAAIPSPFAGSSSQKVVYLSTKTPFMSAVKRVRSLLSQVEKRQMQSDYAHSKKRPSFTRQRANSEKFTEEVVIKATGKAIDKALQLGLFLQNQNDLSINFRTGSVAAVDDINHDDLEQEDVSEGEVPEEIPESRLRFTSMIEVGVSLKD